jgi:hypothetical protein
LDSDRSAKDGTRLQTKYPFGDLEDEEEGSGKARKEKGNNSSSNNSSVRSTKEIIVIESSRQGTAADDQQKIKVIDVRRKEERERRAAAAALSNLGGRNRSCDAVNRLAGGAEVASQHPQAFRQGGGGNVINRRLSECSLPITAVAGSPPPHPSQSVVASGGIKIEDASRMHRTAMTKHDGRYSLRRTTVSDQKQRSFLANNRPGSPAQLFNAPTSISTGHIGGNQAPAGDLTSEQQPAASTAFQEHKQQAITKTATAISSRTTEAGGQVDKNADRCQAARLESQRLTEINNQRHTVNKDASNTQTSLTIGKEIRQNTGPSQPASVTASGDEKAGSPNMDNESIYATIEETTVIMAPDSCPSPMPSTTEVIYASVNKRVKRPDNEAEVKNIKVTGNGSVGLDLSQNNTSLTAPVSNVDGEKKSIGNGDSGGIKDNNATGLKDSNGNPNRETGDGEKNYERKVIYRNPFQGNDESVASTLM